MWQKTMKPRQYQKLTAYIRKLPLQSTRSGWYPANRKRTRRLISTYCFIFLEEFIMASITFTHVNKTYPGNVETIPDLNLEIKDKEFVILVGPSGCGKS